MVVRLLLLLFLLLAIAMTPVCRKVVLVAHSTLKHPFCPRTHAPSRISEHRLRGDSVAWK